ncbi:hypothetical protein R9X47_26795 [Wukongibacter baidiensis]|uniref:hypothetical protein n=1 Tax=Wukongibacter baidiensis TaxID=1723361 RepID=UPI003D7FE599
MMKKVLLFFLLLITLVINRSMIFAVEDNDSNLDETQTLQIKKDINNLLNKRANLWNELFSEEKKLEEITEELKEIVEDPLLTYDIEAFNQIKAQNTGMEKILKVDVLKIKNTILGENEITADIEVEWLMEGFEKNYKEQVDYSMKLIKDDDKWKIYDYKVIEP